MFNQFASNDNGTMSIDDMRKYIIHCGAGDNSASTSRIKHIFTTFGDSESEFMDRFYQILCSSNN